ncbi:MAG: threonine aldolase family protein [Actinomycetota bacterium]
MERPVELRSDTFTKPSDQMRKAMAEAEVGDDVWGEDPTAHALEERCADLLGKEAGLFVPTGSMGNEIAIHVRSNPGEEVVCGEDAHVIEAELGAPATLSQVVLRPLAWTRGVFDEDALKRAIRPASTYFTHTALVCFENTHQGGSGAVVDLETLSAQAAIPREQGVATHLDGARIFNASVASGTPVRDLAACVDTVMFCFSKGLGAPVGSMLVGPRAVIDEGRRVRKMFGGGMRQIGVLCAAAMVALDEGIEPLAEDHANAHRLASGIADAWGLEAVDPSLVQTNIVYIEVGDRSPEVVVGRLAEAGIKVAAMPGGRIRAVTHRDVSGEDIDRAISAFAAL